MTLHIDRKAVGLEYFFSDHSDIFRGLADLNFDDAAKRLKDEFFSVRLPAAFAVRSAFLRFSDDERSCAADVFPAEILPFRDMNLFRLLKGDAVLPFIKWLSELQLKNKLDKGERIANLGTAARRLDMYSRSFVENFFAKSSQRIVLLRRGDDVVLSTAERGWGKANIIFEHCDVSSLPEMPLPGYAFCIELAERKDGFEVGFIIDTHFSECELYERLLNDDGWMEFSFTCRGIKTEANLCDYGGRLYQRGTPRHELVEDACKLLVSKQELLGDAWLSREESDMLPFAYLIHGLSTLLDNDGSLTPELCDAMILKALDNRWAMRRICSTLEEHGCKNAAQVLEFAHNACYGNDNNRALKAAEAFFVILEKSLENGIARSFYQLMSERCVTMSSSCVGRDIKSEAEKRVLAAVQKEVEPLIHSLGFSGSFPNYRRKRNGELEYISLMLYERGERPIHGIISYIASVAAGSTNGKRLDKKDGDIINFEETSALDCLPEAHTLSRYGELCCDYDGIDVKLDVFASADAQFPLLRNESKKLCEFVEYADNQLKGKPLPYRYRRMRTLKTFSYGAFGRAFMHCLPLSIIALIAAFCAYMLVPGFSALISLSPIAFTLSAFSIAAVFNTLASAIYCLAARRRIWRY